MATAHRTATLVTVHEYAAWERLVYEHCAESGKWDPSTSTGTALFQTVAAAAIARRDA